jgi:hypothetical protein
MNNPDMNVNGIAVEQNAWPIVHTAMKPNRSSLFFGVDSEQNLIENKNRLPEDWVYNQKTINYLFNSHGLRMNKELAEVDDEYMVALGCSHSLGIGVCLEDSWPYLMSQQLGIDYINSSVVGASVKLTAINFFNMLNTVKILPKVLAVAWPHAVRYTWYSQGNFLFYLPRHSVKHPSVQIYEQMLATDLTTTEAVFYRNMVKTTCNRLDIKYCETGFESYCDFAKTLKIQTVSGDKSLINEFYARDIRITPDNSMVSHPGIGQHRNAAEILISQL